MTVASDILGPQGLGRILDVTIESLWTGVRRFWRNGPYANALAGEKLSLLNRMIRILRYVFVILAAHVEVKPSRPRPTIARRSRRIALRQPSFPLFAHYRIRDGDAPKHAQPAAFRRAGRDRFLTARRKLEALTRALSAPMPLVRRMARALTTQLMVFRWRPPKRPPRTDRRDFWEELVETSGEARFHLSEYRRRRRDIERAASGSDGSGERKACADE